LGRKILGGGIIIGITVGDACGSAAFFKVSLNSPSSMVISSNPDSSTIFNESLYVIEIHLAPKVFYKG
jgi:hypothetical protein